VCSLVAGSDHATPEDAAMATKQNITAADRGDIADALLDLEDDLLAVRAVRGRAKRRWTERPWQPSRSASRFARHRSVRLLDPARRRP
jgi:hypothetical protein